MKHKRAVLKREAGTKTVVFLFETAGRRLTDEASYSRRRPLNAAITDPFRAAVRPRFSI